MFQEIEERYSFILENVGIDTNYIHYIINAAMKFSSSEIIRIIKSIMGKDIFKYS